MVLKGPLHSAQHVWTITESFYSIYKSSELTRDFGNSIFNKTMISNKLSSNRKNINI